MWRTPTAAEGTCPLSKEDLAKMLGKQENRWWHNSSVATDAPLHFRASMRISMRVEPRYWGKKGGSRRASEPRVAAIVS